MVQPFLAVVVAMAPWQSFVVTSYSVVLDSWCAQITVLDCRRAHQFGALVVKERFQARMKILLINPPRSPHNAIYEHASPEARRFVHRRLVGPPLGLLTVAAAVKDHEVTVLDMKGEYDLFPTARRRMNSSGNGSPGLSRASSASRSSPRRRRWGWRFSAR